MRTSFHMGEIPEGEPPVDKESIEINAINGLRLVPPLGNVHLVFHSIIRAHLVPVFAQRTTQLLADIL